MNGNEAEHQRRLFIAIPVPGDIATMLGDLARDLAAGLPANRLRWVPIDNFHLTLAFLGQSPDRRLAAIESAMQHAALGAATSKLELNQLEIFPDPRRPRVLAATGQAGAGLAALQARLCLCLQEVGFSLREGPWRAHLTLARVRGRRALPGLQHALEPPAVVPVNCLVLYESISRADGPVQYRSMRRVPLQRTQSSD